jgi:hypothetical protein
VTVSSPVTGASWPALWPASCTAWRLAVRLAGGGTVAAGRPIGAAITRAWWPVAVPAAVAVPRLRAPLAALMLAPPLLDWMDLRPPLDPARYLAGRLLGDVAYSIGLWQGCAKQRDVRALLPTTGVRLPAPARPPTPAATMQSGKHRILLKAMNYFHIAICVVKLCVTLSMRDVIGRGASWPGSSS